MRHLLTIDVEEWYEGLPLSAERKQGYEPALTRPMHRLLDLLDEHSAKATFFWLASCAERYPSLVHEAVLRGHEIACHGLSHDPVSAMSPARFAAETSQAKKTIEDIAGVAVDGYRAAYFSINAESLWALDILTEQGFTYDSSIAPIRYWRYGIPEFPRGIQQRSRAGGNIIEYPMNVHRVASMNFPFAGGGYFRLLPYGLVKHCFDRSTEPVVFYLHPWELDSEHPIVPMASTLQISHYLNLKQTERKFQRLLQDFQFTSIAQHSTHLSLKNACVA
jgi:polysaccharide deacetylase family protein (PEP-CTERM system associated)